MHRFITTTLSILIVLFAAIAGAESRGVPTQISSTAMVAAEQNDEPFTHTTPLSTAASRTDQASSSSLLGTSLDFLSQGSLAGIENTCTAGCGLTCSGVWCDARENDCSAFTADWELIHEQCPL